MTGNDRRVAIITGGSQGIGAGLVAGYRGRGWSVVANALTIKPSKDPDVLTVEGDIAKPATADRIIEGALERFGRIDTKPHHHPAAADAPPRRRRAITTSIIPVTNAHTATKIVSTSAVIAGEASA